MESIAAAWMTPVPERYLMVFFPTTIKPIVGNQRYKGDIRSKDIKNVATRRIRRMNYDMDVRYECSSDWRLLLGLPQAGAGTGMSILAPLSTLS